MGHLAQSQELQGLWIQLSGQEAHQNVHGKANVHQNPNRFPARQSVTPEVCQLNRDHTSQHEGAHRHQAVPTEAEQGVGHQHIPAFWLVDDTSQIFLLPGSASHATQAARLCELIWRSRFQGPVVGEGSHLTSRPRRKRVVVIVFLRNLQLHVLHRRRPDRTHLRFRRAITPAVFQHSIQVGRFQVRILFLAALAALAALLIIRGV
mmetsp:Transcript_44827/g.97472  ORF Transcript_44827/g.97472 Transcript_44827/m.97472 type:complete len:206 (+) Transcript_44827:1284-1901(+)